MPWRRLGLFLAIALIATAADLLTKHWAERRLRGRDPIQVIPGCLQFTYSTNTGAAFGAFSDNDGVRDEGDEKWIRLLIAISIVAAVVIPYLVVRIQERPILTALSLGLVEGGVLGNLRDRVMNDGNVRDFILAYVDKYKWPVFNVADSCITVGVILLVYVSFFPGKKKEPAGAKGKGSPPAPSS